MTRGAATASIGAVVFLVAVIAGCLVLVSRGSTAQPSYLPTPAGSVAVAAPAAGTGSPVSPTWLAEQVARTGIGSVAVDAYARATLRLGAERPSCHLGWTTLAALGWVETGHGTHGGAALRADGTTTHRILGPALNGADGLAAIRSDAESASWHGDSTWDHAVGPLQFIPSTWRRWGSDGNGDGINDPNNMFDAAYAAGRYLCASGADLRTGQGWSRAVHSYNHSEEYVRSVLAQANTYATRS